MSTFFCSPWAEATTEHSTFHCMLQLSLGGTSLNTHLFFSSSFHIHSSTNEKLDKSNFIEGVRHVYILCHDGANTPSHHLDQAAGDVLVRGCSHQQVKRREADTITKRVRIKVVCVIFEGVYECTAVNCSLISACAPNVQIHRQHFLTAFCELIAVCSVRWGPRA